MILSSSGTASKDLHPNLLALYVPLWFPSSESMRHGLFVKQGKN
jgi:hypothetical protein